MSVWPDFLKASGLRRVAGPGGQRVLVVHSTPTRPPGLTARAAASRAELSWLHCPESSREPPDRDWTLFDKVIWAGPGLLRFAGRWSPERHHLFKPSFRRRARTVLCCAHRRRGELGRLPGEVLVEIIRRCAGPADGRQTYDDMEVVLGGQRHLFLPGPGPTAGLTDALLDAAFGLIERAS